MSTPKHTQGLLAWYGPTKGEGVTFTHETHIEIKDGCTFACVSGGDDEEAIANAERIVACWNALAGVPDPAVFVAEAKQAFENINKLMAGNLAKCDALRAERDRLRAAVQKYLGKLPFGCLKIGDPIDDAQIELQAALANDPT